MTDKSKVNVLVTVDLETIPSQDEFEFVFNEKEPMLDDVPEHGSLKDVNKIAEYKAKKLISLKQEFFEKKEKAYKEQEKELRSEALHSYQGRVLCIGFALGSGEVQCIDSVSMSEKDMLVEFYNQIKDYKTIGFIGCNVQSFDLPFLFHRALHYRLFKLASILRIDNGYNKGRDFEIMDMFYGGLVWKPKVSLDNICKLLGVSTPKNDLKASEVFDAYKRGEIDRIKEYCKKDVVATRECYKILR